VKDGARHPPHEMWAPTRDPQQPREGGKGTERRVRVFPGDTLAKGMLEGGFESEADIEPTCGADRL
jgi:hypothetical protein